MSTREAIKDNSFSWFWLFNFFFDDLSNHLIIYKTSRFNNSSDFFNQILVKSTSNSSFEYFADLVASWHMIVAEILSEKFGVGSFAYSGGSKEEEKLLFAGGEVVSHSAG